MTVEDAIENLSAGVVALAKTIVAMKNGSAVNGASARIVDNLASIDDPFFDIGVEVVEAKADETE